MMDTMPYRRIVSESTRKEIFRFIRFSIVGVGNTIIDFGIYFLLTQVMGLYYLFANTLSWTIAVCFSFILNKYWTFNVVTRENIVQQYTKFFLVSVIGLGLSLGFLYVFVDAIGMHELTGKIITVGLVVFWNFFANKFYTFRHAGS